MLARGANGSAQKKAASRSAMAQPRPSNTAVMSNHWPVKEHILHYPDLEFGYERRSRTCQMNTIFAYGIIPKPRNGGVFHAGINTMRAASRGEDLNNTWLRLKRMFWKRNSLRPAISRAYLQATSEGYEVSRAE